MFWFKKKKTEEKQTTNTFNVSFSMDFDGNIIIKSSWPLYATENFLANYALMLSYIQAGKVNDKIMDAVAGYGRMQKDALGSDFICKTFIKTVASLKEHEDLLKHNDRNQVVIRPSEVFGMEENGKRK